MPKSKKLTSENEIRDYLCEHLELIEPNLTLINKEQYLPNDKGARGFVDIFARSKGGKLVIIEIKRSDAAARQAIQELMKYSSLIRKNLLIKETEYKLVVLSTDWHELLTPFSEFYHKSFYQIEGKKLNISDKNIINISDIDPLSLEQERKFSRRHYIWEFTEEEGASKAVQVIAKFMHEVGLNDFILVFLKTTQKPSGISHIVYFAQQQQSFDDYLVLIKKRFSSEEVDEFIDYVSGFPEEEDQIEEAADKVWEMNWEGECLSGLIECAGQQISHPEKAVYWLNEENSIILKVYRFGRLTKTDIMDQTIIDELIGHDGTSRNMLVKSAEIAIKPEVKSFHTAIENFYYNNSFWKQSLLDLLKMAIAQKAKKISLQAFNNDDIITTLAYAAIGDLYKLPIFKMSVESDNEHETFIGQIGWDGRQVDLDEVIKDYFSDDTFGYFTAYHFGAHRSMNEDIMETLGFKFRLQKLDLNDEMTDIRVRGSSISVMRRVELLDFVDCYTGNKSLLMKSRDLFLAHDHQYNIAFEEKRHEAFLFAEQELLEKYSTETKKNDVAWSGEVNNCDVCKRDMNNVQFMADTSYQGGPWGCMCSLCLMESGGKIEWGSGQLYRKQNNEWALIAGEMPNKDDDLF